MQDFRSIIYLDKEFISEQYAYSKDVFPQTKITKSESINTGIKALFVSAGTSSIESKTFEHTTTQMLHELSNELADYDAFNSKLHQVGSSSKYAWVDGGMFPSVVTVTRKKSTILGKAPALNSEDQEKLIAEEPYFSIHDQNSNKFALITSSDYFSSGIEPLLTLRESVVGEVELKVRALLRVLPAKSSFNEWLAIPLVVLEQSD
ncbi:hypothetical protein [Neptunomonas marina]|uniref:Uncharacterized protein n=1 Tax=Neptunomonas marina TaxID=1815562 RepID=A0A437QD61_9GAMM|nr:hypothetical protein [Neptunomonas marina]RVU32477.1 hypothetical protein EOE65_02170 [Neptunomonas marina]